MGFVKRPLTLSRLVVPFNNEATERVILAGTLSSHNDWIIFGRATDGNAFLMSMNKAYAGLCATLVAWDRKVRSTKMASIVLTPRLKPNCMFPVALCIMDQ
jgi:hypothetical protein